MAVAIRKLRPEEHDLYLRLVSTFYATDGVDHPIPAEHIERTFQELCRSDDYALCYIIEQDQKVAGYALLAKTFSQEGGGLTVWLEEIYILPEFRGGGLGAVFLQWLKQEWAGRAARLRLEVVPSHDRVKALYARSGFTALEYDQMVLDMPQDRKS